MSTTYELTGRSQQKQRTRAAVIAAARELIAEGGRAPTVAEAAASASVSRTTAYRYFPSQTSLLLAAFPSVGATSLLPDDAPEDPEARLETVVRAFLALTLESEPQQRTMLRVSLDADHTAEDLPLRQGRGIGWFAEALEPLVPQLGEQGVRDLAVAIRAVAGIEPLVWLVDVAGLDREAAVEQMVWSAAAVLRRAVADA